MFLRDLAISAEFSFTPFVVNKVSFDLFADIYTVAQVVFAVFYSIEPFLFGFIRFYSVLIYFLSLLCSIFIRVSRETRLVKRLAVWITGTSIGVI